MTIQLHHQTRLSIDVRASHGREAPQSAPHAAPARSGWPRRRERLAGRFPAAFLADLTAELREHLIAAEEIGNDANPRHSADSGDEDDGNPDPER